MMINTDPAHFIDCRPVCLIKHHIEPPLLEAINRLLEGDPWATASLYPL